MIVFTKERTARVARALDHSKGGATPTMALAPGSPAINAGDNNGSPATDQRGIPRPRTTQNACDVGAFENSYIYLPLIKK